jgi:hypothetical protein
VTDNHGETGADRRPDEPLPGGPPAQPGRPALDDQARRDALQRSGAGERATSPEDAGEPTRAWQVAAAGPPKEPLAPRDPGPGAGSAWSSAGSAPAAATAATTGAGSAVGTPSEARTTVLPAAERRPDRPAPRPEPRPGASRAAARPAPRPAGRSRRARLVLQRLDPWSVFLFSLVASICLGIVLLVAVAALYFILSSLGVLSSVNNVLGEVLGGAGPDEVAAPFFTAGRVLGATAVLAAVDVVLLTVLATLGALLYNLCASLTGGIEVVLGERD